VGLYKPRKLNNFRNRLKRVFINQENFKNFRKENSKKNCVYTINTSVLLFVGGI